MSAEQQDKEDSGSMPVDTDHGVKVGGASYVDNDTALIDWIKSCEDVPFVPPAKPEVGRGGQAPFKGEFRWGAGTALFIWDAAKNQLPALAGKLSATTPPRCSGGASESSSESAARSDEELVVPQGVLLTWQLEYRDQGMGKILCLPIDAGVFTRNELAGCLQSLLQSTIRPETGIEWLVTWPEGVDDSITFSLFNMRRETRPEGSTVIGFRLHLSETLSSLLNVNLGELAQVVSTGVAKAIFYDRPCHSLVKVKSIDRVTPVCNILYQAPKADVNLVNVPSVDLGFSRTEDKDEGWLMSSSLAPTDEFVETCFSTSKPTQHPSSTTRSDLGRSENQSDAEAYKDIDAHQPQSTTQGHEPAAKPAWKGADLLNGLGGLRDAALNVHHRNLLAFPNASFGVSMLVVARRESGRWGWALRAPLAVDCMMDRIEYLVRKMAGEGSTSLCARPVFEWLSPSSNMQICIKKLSWVLDERPENAKALLSLFDSLPLMLALLRRYLTCLPEPLFPHASFNKMASAAEGVAGGWVEDVVGTLQDSVLKAGGGVGVKVAIRLLKLLSDLLGYGTGGCAGAPAARSETLVSETLVSETLVSARSETLVPCGEGPAASQEEGPATAPEARKLISFHRPRVAGDEEVIRGFCLVIMRPGEGLPACMIAAPRACAAVTVLVQYAHLLSCDQDTAIAAVDTCGSAASNGKQSSPSINPGNIPHDPARIRL